MSKSKNTISNKKMNLSFSRLSLLVSRYGGIYPLIQKILLAFKKRVVTKVLHRGWRVIRRMMSGSDYQEWILNNEPGAKQLAEQRLKINEFNYKPLISVVVPVWNTPLKILEKTIRSVVDQTYDKWELCIADDNSSNPAVRELIEKHAAEDPRIRFIFRAQNGHISAASNSALELAQGEYVALLDHDDLLHPAALYYTVEAINLHPDAEIIYSDEDKVDSNGKRKDPYFKTDFNYDLFLSQNMISHLGVYKTETVRRVGGFRLGLEGSQDYDLALRILETIHPSQIIHIPRVLYHWRVSEQSTASGAEAKPYAYMAGLRALREHLLRTGKRASVEFLPHLSSYQVTFTPTHLRPSMEIVIAVEKFSMQLVTCVTALLANEIQGGYNIKIHIADENLPSGSLPQDPSITVIQHPAGTRRAAMINKAAASANSEYLCILSEDVQGFSENWLSSLMGRAQQPDTGAVAPLILLENGCIHGSGIVLKPDGNLIRLFAGLSIDSIHYFGWAHLPRQFSVLADECLLVKCEHLLNAGGLDEQFFSYEYAVADFCLKLQEMGKVNVVVPQAQVQIRHHILPFDWRKEMTKDKTRFQQHWKSIIQHDPAFNPNLDVSFGRVILAKRAIN